MSVSSRAIFNPLATLSGLRFSQLQTVQSLQGVFPAHVKLFGDKQTEKQQVIDRNLDLVILS